MKPGLLAIGGSYEEAADLLHIHEDLMGRLRVYYSSRIITRPSNFIQIELLLICEYDLQAFLKASFVVL
ncbi:hypothetical protein ANCDUO_00237 [Ancylostoma duodenale]|uniref:Uncharacterized protein n=1 Tax=Ancylostoma duodenale TaxID=51022 RepID=A0A0C2DHJ8_9BILA|nr:hypothetical protein ANCDUO_00237 [Ancylostoma duodenale]